MSLHVGKYLKLVCVYSYIHNLYVLFTCIFLLRKAQLEKFL